MFPLLGVVLAELGTEELLHILGYALLTAGASYVLNQLQSEQNQHVDAFSSSHGEASGSGSSDYVDVFSATAYGSYDATDIPQSVDIGNISQSGEMEASGEVEASEGGEGVSDSSTSDGSVSDSGPIQSDYEVSYNPSVSGENLIDVLKSSGQNTGEGLKAIAEAISNLKIGSSTGAISSEVLEPLRREIARGNELLRSLVIAISGLGLILGRGININLPREVVESSISTKRVMDALSTPIEVNPEEAAVRGTPIEILARASGVQSQTFADINSFEVSDDDIPDLPSGIDLSAIFRFLRVSSQLQGGT